MRRTLLATILLAATTPVWAQPAPYGGSWYPPGPGAVPPPVTAGPAQQLREGLDALVAYLSSGQVDEVALGIYLQEKVAPAFDFDRMAYQVAGPRWGRMTATQREALRNRLKGMFLEALARQLLTAGATAEPQIRFSRPRFRGPRRVEISARILQPNRYPVVLKFTYMLGDDGWKIVDVASNGSSAVAYYRNYFFGGSPRMGMPARYY